MKFAVFSSLAAFDFDMDGQSYGQMQRQPKQMDLKWEAEDIFSVSRAHFLDLAALDPVVRWQGFWSTAFLKPSIISRYGSWREGQIIAPPSLLGSICKWLPPKRLLKSANQINIIHGYLPTFSRKLPLDLHFLKLPGFRFELEKICN